ncbi:hypothetical protein SEVIR_3G084501v4 [Setaria viridis]
MHLAMATARQLSKFRSCAAAEEEHHAHGSTMDSEPTEGKTDMMQTWKKSGRTWCGAAVGSEATPSNVNSPAACSTTFRYTSCRVRFQNSKLTYFLVNDNVDKSTGLLFSCRGRAFIERYILN